MNEKRELYPINYSENLSVINNLNFTPREIDVMACLLSARGTSKIAAFLSIAPKTVVNHIQHIMQKISCNSREGIIDFIERSNNQNLLRVHYSQLLLQSSFKKSLKKIAKLAHKPLGCSFIYWEDKGNDHLLLKNLKADLELTGLNVLLEPREKENLGAPLIEPATSEHYSIYVMPKHFKDIETLTHSEGPSIIKNSSDKSLFLFIEKEDFQEIPQKFSGEICIDCTDSKNYYFIVFNILKSLFHDINIDEIILEFTEQNEVTNGSSEGIKHQEAINEQKQIYSLPLGTQWIKEKKWFFLAGLIALICVTGFVLLNDKKAEKGPSIRSDLIIPHHNVLLNRPEIIAELDKYLVGKDGIKTVAIVGTGGAGKTTIARQYAHAQKENIIWEINAETQESLKGSFEKLAQKLAKTESDEKELKNIQNIMDVAAREEKILEFVKNHLRLYSNWFLIYDNVEKLIEIDRYFPQDAKTWGQGEVLITTRNINIQNNSQIKHVISIGELNQKQKRDLFRQIMASGSGHHSAAIASKEENAFLDKIPPFPLDISLAANYIKITNISYASYLDHLDKQDEEFVSTQTEISKEAGTYLKTRYHIITLSLENMIKNHKDFRDLLFFISMLDSQNIPRDLLNKYKNDTIVDKFIYNLKKYSLITDELFTSTEQTFSMHRSTRAITLTHLIKKLNLEKNEELIESIGSTFGNYLDDLLENWNITKLRKIISHCEMFLSHKNLFTDSIRGDLSIKLGGIYSIDHYNFSPLKAKKFLEKALQSLDKHNPKNYNSIAQGLFFLSFISWDMCDYEKSKFYGERSIEICKKYCPKNQLGLARASAFLAYVIRKLGYYEKSKNLVEQALSIYHQHYPDNHVNIAWSLSFLGAAYYELGHYEKAKIILEKCLSIYTKYYSKNYGALSRISYDLGRVHWKLNHYEKAKYYIKKSTEIAKNHFPNVNYCIECSLTVLGNIYRDLHEYENARDILENGLISCKKRYGENHFETGKILRDLGKLYLLENNIQKADAFFKSSLNIFQKTNHVDLYTVLESIADLCLKKSSILANQGKIQQSKYLKEQAINYLKQALEVVANHISADSPLKDPIELKLKNLEKS